MGEVTRVTGKKCIENNSGKPEGKKLLQRPRRRWEDNFKVNLKGTGVKMWTEFIWRCIGYSG
jgi:hypothetical protein